MNKVHMIGIGGIGMSALAQLLKYDDQEVSGSDRTESPVTELLHRKGIPVTIGHRAENVPQDTMLVVYSDSVLEDNAERVRARELGISQKSYFEMLGQLSKTKKTIAVAGTHGKTTTTGMLAKILVDAGASPTAIIGSIVEDFESNYIAGTSDIFVVEACEYRDHLLQLSPSILVITNLEWDHTDWFPTLEAMQETFKKALERVPSDGVIVTDTEQTNIKPLLANAKARVVDYTKEPPYETTLLGEFNVQNARVAGAAARALLPEIPDTTIYGSIRNFRGTWRRFEYKGQTKNGTKVYDDYAHHPTAVHETLSALRKKVKGKIFVAFHPHLFSRTRDLLDEFSTAFTDATSVIVAPIFGAREEDDGTISNEVLAEHLRNAGTKAVAINSFADIETALLTAGADDVIVTMGAGDIYKVADALVARLGHAVS